MAENNRKPEGFSKSYPSRHNNREKKVIESAENTVRLQTEEQFFVSPLCGAKLGAGAATGTAGDENLAVSGENVFEYHILGTQTIVGPAHSANGLNINMDETDNDGVEWSQGITALAKHAYTVGTTKAFYFEVELSLEDVSGFDECAVGWRKAEAYQAAIDDYDEMACMNIDAGNILIETILNAGATSTTDTTNNLADAGTVKLRVEVGDSGIAKYLIDGADPIVDASRFTFDDGEVLVPFLFLLNDSDVGGYCRLTSWRCGLISADK
jgi:hypothetical protein